MRHTWKVMMKLFDYDKDIISEVKANNEEEYTPQLFQMIMKLKLKKN